MECSSGVRPGPFTARLAAAPLQRREPRVLLLRAPFVGIVLCILGPLYICASRCISAKTICGAFQTQGAKDSDYLPRLARFPPSMFHHPLIFWRHWLRCSCQ